MTTRRQRHVLIDFGSTEMPNSASARPHEAHRRRTSPPRPAGKLDVLVATHRHADHISGFGDSKAGPIIEGLKPDLVVQPWTEDPDLETDARAPAVAAAPDGHAALSRTLANMQAFAAGARAEGLRLQKCRGLPEAIAERLRSSVRPT